MKNNYDDILATTITQSTQERTKTYRSYPQYADRLRRDVKLADKLGSLGSMRPEAQSAFKSVLDSISTKDTQSLRYHNIAKANQVDLSHKKGWLTVFKLYIPVAAILLVVGVVGFMWSKSGTRSTNTVPVANGSVNNANQAMIQDGSSEQSAASVSDGSADIYTASSNSLQQLGNSTNENF